MTINKCICGGEAEVSFGSGLSRIQCQRANCHRFCSKENNAATAARWNELNPVPSLPVDLEVARDAKLYIDENPEAMGYTRVLGLSKAMPGNSTDWVVVHAKGWVKLPIGFVGWTPLPAVPSPGLLSFQRWSSQLAKDRHPTIQEAFLAGLKAANEGQEDQ